MTIEFISLHICMRNSSIIYTKRGTQNALVSKWIEDLRKWAFMVGWRRSAGKVKWEIQISFLHGKLYNTQDIFFPDNTVLYETDLSFRTIHSLVWNCIIWKKKVQNESILNNQDVDIVANQVSFARFQRKIDFSFCLVIDKG